ncbi:MAG: 2'-5' RNA ligase family protein [Dongia sp.]
MDPQLSFFGTPKRRPMATGWPRREAPSVVTYFAILPPEEVRIAIVRLRQETVAREGIFGRPVKPERLHLSIAPLMRCSSGDLPDFAREVAPLADGIVAHAMMSAFDMVLDRVQTFNTKDRDAAHRRYYLVLDGSDVPGLLRLNDLFRQSLVRSGLGAAMPKAFNPHLTLFYANRPIAPRDIAPIRWTVRDVALVQSVHGQGRYEILKRWALPGR